MNLLRDIIDNTWEELLALLGALCVLLPTSPINMRLVYRDSGVFLYMGWRILNGEVPYRDIWDHKPPVIYYINALGLALSNNSRWGVWAIELIMLFVAAFLGFQLIKKIFGLFPSVFSLLLWLLSLVYVLQGGNLTTEYTLPLQFGALWLFYHTDSSKHSDRNFLLIGFTGAISFFTKQTAIGIWIAIVVYLITQRLLSRRVGQGIREIGFISLGSLLFSSIVLVFFTTQGALLQFWNAAFEYNFVYTARTTSNLSTDLITLTKGIKPVTQAGLFQIAMIGYAIATTLILFRRNFVEKASPIILVGLLNLPIELILIGLPGKTFPHYYMTLLPVLSFFAGVAFWGFFSLASNWKTLGKIKYVIALLVTVFFIRHSFDDYINQLYMYRRYSKNLPVIKYLQENTSPNEQILLWGDQTYINFFTQRKSPTRFVYQFPLHQEGYVDEMLINQFLDDIIRNQPKYIINTDPKNPLYSFPLTSEPIRKKTIYLEANYCMMKRIDTWKIYKYSKGGCSP